MVPQAVVFDIGKVLLDFDFSRSARNLAPLCAAPEQEVFVTLNQSPLLHRYETGLLTTDGFFAEFTKATGYRGTRAQFEVLFADIFTTIDPMIDLQRTLRRRGIPTYIFSNTNALAIGFIRRHYPFFKNFNAYVLSYEEGAMKPKGAIYDAVERATGLRGASLLYLDDREENVAAGAERGWQIIHHLDPEPTLAAVKRSGVI